MFVKRIFSVCALMATLGFSRVAAAQTAPPPQQPPVVRETVEVVATRIPEAPHDVAAPIEVLTGDDLRNLGATTLKDALSLAAGISIAPGGDGGPAGAVPEFWGLREFDAFLLVVDGVPWGGAFNPALASLSMRDVERVEILRGAAPVTYGATSFVGVIHVVHKAAAADTSYFGANLGSYQSGGASVDYALPSAGDWKQRISADFNRQGFRDDRSSYGQGHALYRAAKTDSDRRMWFTGDLNLLRQDPASPRPRQGTMLSPLVAVDANYNPDGAYINENRIALSSGMERPLAVMGQDARLNAVVSFTHTAENLFRGFITDISESENNAIGLRQRIDTNDLYADAHLVFPPQNDVQFVAGADFLHGNGSTHGATFNYTVPLSGLPATGVTKPTDLTLGSEDRREFLGGYGLAEWKPNDLLTVSAGLRINLTFEEKGEFGAEGETDGGKDPSETNFRFSGNVGAIYTTWQEGVDHVKVYGNYRNTFKPAAFDFGLGEAVEAGLLKPETARSFEGGVKARMLQARVDMEASIFRMDFSNLVSSTVVDGLPALENAGETRFQGLDLASEVRWLHSISGRVTYSFHDAKFVDFVKDFDGVLTQLAGKRFEMSPRHLFSVGGFYAPPLGAFGNIVIKYSGNRYMDKRNRALAPGFSTVDLGVGYRFEKYELRLDGRNLGDRRDPVAESELGDAQYYLMFPRDFRFSVGFRF
jgi:outer membrane receptor protein involved in Fe transport